MSYVMVYITTKKEKESKNIAEELLKERLAACVNIIPSVESRYLWKGKIKKASESVMLVKTREELVERLIEKVKEEHSYDVPCIDVLPILKGNNECFQWIDESVKRDG